MFVPGGLDFDGIEETSNTSSEDDNNRKELLSSRSDQSNISTDSATSVKSARGLGTLKTIFQSSILENEADVNSSAIKQKEMVVNEIKQKVFSSDSERENDLNESMEGLEYGCTPPREHRRNKQKYKCVKFNNDISISQSGFNIKKNTKKNSNKTSQPSGNTTNFSSYHWQRQRSEERREKHHVKAKSQTVETMEEIVPIPIKLVRVNSSKSLKSISQQKTTNVSSRSHHEHQNSRKFFSSAVKFATAKKDVRSKSSSRHHFYKSFSLLVNMGGRFPFQQHHSSTLEIEEEDNFQVSIF